MDNYNNFNNDENGENITPDTGENNAPAWSEPVIQPVESERTAETYSPNHYNVENEYSVRQNVYEKPKKQKKKRSHGFLKAVCIILVSVLLSSTACYFVTGYVVERKMEDATNTVVFGPTGNNDSANTEQEEIENVPVYTGEELSSQEVYNIAKNQVVGITTAVTTTNLFGQATSSATTGSGFIISEDGYIMTNYHVVEYAVTYGGTVTVMTYSGEEYSAKIAAYNSDNDIALLKVEATGLDAVQYSYDITVGEVIYAVGNPLGELSYTMTSGIVSALDRIISTTDATTGVSKSINMFQIDAAVNSGNSGGPVYNSRGEVVGIVTAKYSSSGIEGLGFAIPMEDALNIASQLLEKGYVSGAQLGIQALNVDEVYSAFAIEYYGYPMGVCIMSVNEGSGAERAGLRTGDIITSIGGVTVKSVDELKSALKKYEAGDKAELKVFRVGTTLDVGEDLDITVVLEESQTSGTVTEDSNQQKPQNQQVPQNQQPMPHGDFGGGYWYN